MPHPIQDMFIDEDCEGNRYPRFRENKIVRFLLDSGQFDMNSLAVMEFSQDDREQFAQLIGYSLSGFAELSYVNDKTYERAKRKAFRLTRKDQQSPCPAVPDPTPAPAAKEE